MYKLINPIILGNVDFEVKDDNISNAVVKMWNKMSEHMSDFVPNFTFSLIENGSNKLYHYNIKENNNKNNEAEFNIEQIIINDNKLENDMINKYNNYMTMKYSLVKNDNDKKGGAENDKLDDDENKEKKWKKRYKNLINNNDLDYVIDYEKIRNKLYLMNLYNYYVNPIYYVNYYPYASLNLSTSYYMPRFFYNPLVEIDLLNLFN